MEYVTVILGELLQISWHCICVNMRVLWRLSVHTVPHYPVPVRLCPWLENHRSKVQEHFSLRLYLEEGLKRQALKLSALDGLNASSQHENTALFFYFTLWKFHCWMQKTTNTLWMKPTLHPKVTLDASDDFHSFSLSVCLSTPHPHPHLHAPNPVAPVQDRPAVHDQ